MVSWNNCPACGVMVELQEKRCPVCGTPIPRPRKQAQAVAVAMTPNEAARLYTPGNYATVMQIIEELQRGTMTMNQARALYGLPPV